jgi:hypothetical protein
VTEATLEEKIAAIIEKKRRPFLMISLPVLSGRLDQGFQASFAAEFFLCHRILFPIRQEGSSLCDAKNRTRKSSIEFLPPLFYNGPKLMDHDQKEDSMRRNAAVVCALFILYSLTCLTTGCSSEESKTVVTPEGKATVTTKTEGEKSVVKVETKEGTLTVQSGSQAISEAEVGVPFYPGAKVVHSGRLAETKDAASDIAASYSLTTNDSFDKVVSFYKSNLKDVQHAMDQSMGDQKMSLFMTGKEGDMRTIQVMASTAGGPTNIQITKVVDK